MKQPMQSFKFTLFRGLYGGAFSTVPMLNVHLYKNKQ